MNKFGIVLSVLFLVIGVRCFSQGNYKVESIYSIPNSEYYLIKVRKIAAEDNDEFTVLSKANEQNRDGIEFKEKDTLQLNLKEVVKGPSFSLFPKIRGDQTFYIDGVKIYDSDEILYSSSCLEGLYRIKECERRD